MNFLDKLLHDTVLSPVFLAAVAGILILERILPTDPEQPTLSAGFIQDSVWLVLGLAFTGTVLAAYTEGLKALMKGPLHFLVLPGSQRLPEAARILIGVLLGDFLAWFQHWVKHKVPWFWEFHAVHHSQRQMNLFTDLRFHYVEYLISRPIVLLPLLMLQVDALSIIGFGLLSTWQTRFYHANIRTNLGFLQYLFVTPQSHRIHHSIEAKHHDLNFGVMFSFWDRIFRTQYTGYEEYPKTGIKDASFPLEKKGGVLTPFTTFLKQLLHPFLVIGGWRGR